MERGGGLLHNLASKRRAYKREGLKRGGGGLNRASMVMYEFDTKRKVDLEATGNKSLLLCPNLFNYI